MARLVVFLVFLTFIGGLFGLSKYRSFEVEQKSFDFAVEKKQFEEKEKLIEELNHKHDAPAPVVEEVEEVVAQAFEVTLDSPALENGYKVYHKVGQCVLCHGKSGEGKKSQNAPRVGGQFAWYLTKQLVDMKKGVRVNKVMNTYLEKITEQDMKDVAEYMSKFPWQ
jgi:cytochrome c553